MFSWDLKLESITKKRPSQIIEELQPKIERAQESLFLKSLSQPLTSEEALLLNFYHGLEEILHKDRQSGRPAEFIANLGEWYLFGRKTFLKMYGDLFDDMIAEKLYIFVKDEIFKGKEWSEFPIEN